MNPDKAKALQNSLKRPVKTSKLNPYAMRWGQEGEVRVAPRIAALSKAGVKAPWLAAERKAYYAGDKQDARATAASMLRNFRKTKMLSRADTKAIVEFAAMDLGQDMSSSLCSPCSGAEKSKKYYPSLYVSGVKKLDLPMKGKATIEYRIRSTTDRQDDNGNVSKSADIEVLSIDPTVAKIAPKAGGKAVVTKTDFQRDLREVVEFARGDQAIAHAAKKGWLSPAPYFHSESAGTMARGAEDSIFRASEIARLARDRGAKANPKLGWTRRELAQSIARDRSPGLKIARAGK